MSKLPPPCKRQQELIEQTQEYLIKLAELARRQADAVANRDNSVVMALDKEIERTLGQKERALGALHEHREEHGC